MKQKSITGKKLNRHESIELAIITMMIPRKDAETVTENVCNLIQKDTLMDYNLKRDICPIINIMLGKNIPDKNKREQIRKVMKMSEYISAIDAVVAEEKYNTRATDVNMILSIIDDSINKGKSLQEAREIILKGFQHLE